MRTLLSPHVLPFLLNTLIQKRHWTWGFCLPVPMTFLWLLKNWLSWYFQALERSFRSHVSQPFDNTTGPNYALVEAANDVQLWNPTSNFHHSSRWIWQRCLMLLLIAPLLEILPLFFCIYLLFCLWVLVRSSICVCACGACMHLGVYLYVCTSVSKWRPEEDMSCPSSSFSTLLPWSRVSPWTGRFSFCQGQLASEFPWSAFLHSATLVLQPHGSQLAWLSFTRLLRIQP